MGYVLLRPIYTAEIYSSFAVLLENNAFIFWKQHVCTCGEHDIGLVGIMQNENKSEGWMWDDKTFELWWAVGLTYFSGGVWD